MMEIMIAEMRCLADLTARHQNALLIQGQLSRRLKIVSDNGASFRDEDETALVAARNDADLWLRSIEEYAPIDVEEQMSKALYISALMLAQGSRKSI